MLDFDSSCDSGEVSVDESGSESVDISESGSEADIDSDQKSYVDISESNGNIEVTIPSETEAGSEINLENETKENVEIDIGDVSSDASFEFDIGDLDGGKSEEVNNDEIIDKSDEVDIDGTDVDKSVDVNTDPENEDTIDETVFEDKEALSEYLEKESTYSMEVNKYISSPEELQVYQDAGLVEKSVDGRVCLIREDLDLDYVDKQSGLTNAELIAKGRAPYDAKTGERIELHHIGQDFDAPFAELKSATEHDTYSKTLHKSEMDSWRRDPEKVNQYSAQRKAHWKNRV